MIRMIDFVCLLTMTLMCNGVQAFVPRHSVVVVTTTPTKPTIVVQPSSSSSAAAASARFASSSTSSSSSSSSSLTRSEQERAQKVFTQFGGGTEEDAIALEPSELINMLQALDIPASEEEAGALFKYLDQDGNGQIALEEFLPWYEQAASVAKEQAASLQTLLCSRRTVDAFLTTTDIDDNVLRRAIQCAIAAPNRRGSEPWRFIKLGKDTVANVAALKARMKGAEDMDTTIQRWTQIPGWCVVTYPRNPAGNNWEQREDFKSVCCAIENFMLSMWSEGIGSKWTDGEIQRTREFAELCGINYDKEKVAGVIWYGFASGGLQNAGPKKRKKSVDDVLEIRP